jgi:hypothetical protein
VTSSLDYEGELGVIVGKGGIGIKADNAWDHVWGAVIVNDVSGYENPLIPVYRERKAEGSQAILYWKVARHVLSNGELSEE